MTTPTTERATMLPCPFCGGREIFVEPDERGSGGQHIAPYHVGCVQCKAEQCEDDEDDARAAWNRRATAESDAIERALLARLGEQKPVAWLWQHEETGRSGFVDAWQVENGWQEANPRNKIIRPVYDHPSPAPVGAQEREALATWHTVAERSAAQIRDGVKYLLVSEADAVELGGALEAARPAAQGAAQVPAGVDDLATLVVRLVRALRKAAPGNELSYKAMDYLMRHDLAPSPFRGGSQPAAPGNDA